MAPVRRYHPSAQARAAAARLYRAHPRAVHLLAVRDGFRPPAESVLAEVEILETDMAADRDALRVIRDELRGAS